MVEVGAVVRAEEVLGSGAKGFRLLSGGKGVQADIIRGLLRMFVVVFVLCLRSAVETTQIEVLVAVMAMTLMTTTTLNNVTCTMIHSVLIHSNTSIVIPMP